MSASPECPFCGAADAERVAQWAGQIITSQWRCGACGSYFEALREDFDGTFPSTTEEERDVAPPDRPPRPRRGADAVA